MKIYHFTIIFAVFSGALLWSAFMNLNEKTLQHSDTEFLSEALDDASQSAALVLAGSSASGIQGIKDSVIDTFYSAFAANLGLTGNTLSMTNLKLYVPVIIVVDEDELFVCYDNFSEDEEGNVSLTRGWSKNLMGTTDINEIIAEYCSRHNETAQRAGIQYGFSLPENEGGIFFRGKIEEGIYVLFQGYPISTTGGTYNRYSFAATGVVNKEELFINVAGDGYGSPLYFHRKGCVFLSDNSECYLERRECAQNGAFECPSCGYH